MDRSKQGGVTYLIVLLVVATMGIWLAAVGTMWSTVARREKELMLLEIGHAYRQAIGQYYLQSPGSVQRYPPDLSQLVLDRRFLQTRRHLRKIYVDPITGTADWGLVRAPDGGIMGVYSRSEQEPLKKAGFRKIDEEFEGSVHYSGWQFRYVPPVAPENFSVR